MKKALNKNNFNVSGNFNRCWLAKWKEEYESKVYMV